VNNAGYVVYKDDNVLNARGTLMRFNGTMWEYKGLYSLAHADTSSLFVYKGTPYVGFNDVVAPTASTAAMAILDF